ncbi:hypothetical protein [Rubrivivax gelatinosus]|uniref:Uncharacterized protein n=1 Tax=Rubrivivax gelatinosus TaxID=28068 RepID=A0ABS1DP82_RUBGE|nr:hypothetical protein [Rubrivivax gelatinosus]MBK1711278.1 hypothetical protein [Rubrivivax gelatinosus]
MHLALVHSSPTAAAAVPGPALQRFDVVHVDDDGRRRAYSELAPSARAAEDRAVDRFGMPRLLRAWRAS